MLTKKDIIEQIKLQNYPYMEYWVNAGAALVMQGVKSTTRDIDLGCTRKLADFLIQQGAKWSLLEDGVNRRIEAGDTIEIFEDWLSKDLISPIVDIGGICVASLECIRQQKVELNRPKDWDDIALIDQFIENQNQGEKL